jgi:hypothetical protein
MEINNEQECFGGKVNKVPCRRDLKELDFIQVALNVELTIYNCAISPVYHGAEIFVRIR